MQTPSHRTPRDLQMKSIKEAEVDTLRRELSWLLQEEIHGVLDDVRRTISECKKRFSASGTSVTEIQQKSQKILLTSSSGAQSVKCMLTLRGDRIYDADINFKHKRGKEHNIFKTGFHHDQYWQLQQVQDAANHLTNALAIISDRGKDHEFQSVKEANLVIDEISSSIQKSRECLTLPKRKSVDDLINNRNLQLFQPAVPSDVALSFYVHSSKLIMALYQLHQNGQHKVEITSRQQVECVVQWLSEAIFFLNLAIKQCQQFKTKLQVLCQYDIVH